LKNQQRSYRQIVQERLALSGISLSEKSIQAIKAQDRTPENDCSLPAVEIKALAHAIRLVLGGLVSSIQDRSPELNPLAPGMSGNVGGTDYIAECKRFAEYVAFLGDSPNILAFDYYGAYETVLAEDSQSTLIHKPVTSETAGRHSIKEIINTMQAGALLNMVISQTEILKVNFESDLRRFTSLYKQFETGKHQGFLNEKEMLMLRDVVTLAQFGYQTASAQLVHFKSQVVPTKDSPLR
jgi:hypothetical protein